MTWSSQKEKPPARKEQHYRRFAREWAMQFLFQRDALEEADRQDDLERLLGLFWEQLELSDDCPEHRDYKRGRKAAETIVRGVLANLAMLDAMISEHSTKWDIDRMDPVDRNIMRVAIYEMLKGDKVPAVVCINEAVEIGKTFGTEFTGAFVNGILNTIKEKLPALIAAASLVLPATETSEEGL